MDTDLNCNPLISVNIPLHNSELYIKDAILSIIKQTYQNFEIIIVNDGSNDRGPEIVHSINDSRIKLFNNEKNEGIVYSRNKAIEYSSGKYIAILDSDDIAISERFEKQVYFLENNPEFAMVGSWYETINKNGEPTGQVIKFEAENSLIRSQLFWGNYFAQSSILIRREVITEFKYNLQLNQAEDYLLWSQISMKYKVANLNSSLIQYRLHDNNISARRFDEQEQCVKMVYAYHLKQLGIKELSRRFVEFAL